MKIQLTTNNFKNNQKSKTIKKHTVVSFGQKTENDKEQQKNILKHFKENTNKMIEKLKYFAKHTSNPQKALEQATLTPTTPMTKEEKEQNKIIDIKPLSQTNQIPPVPETLDKYKSTMEDLKSDKTITEDWFDEHPEFALAVLKTGFTQLSPAAKKTLADSVKIPNNRECYFKDVEKAYKKECKKYVDSLIPYVQSEDDDICISAMELLGKYGFTEKHLVELAGFAGTNETEPRIIRAFVNAIADFGIPERSGFISNFLERTDNINLYDTETLKTIINGLDRIGNLEEIKVLEKYLKHDNAEVRELAQKAIDSIKSRGTFRGYEAYV